MADFLTPGSIDRSAFVQARTTLLLARSADLRLGGLAAVEADPGAQRLLLPQRMTQRLTQGRFAPVLREGGAISAAAFLREGRRDPLSPAALAAPDTMVHRLGHAMSIVLRHRRLRDESPALQGALGHLDFGLLTVTVGLTIREAKPEAEPILAGADGLARRPGRMVVARNAVQSALPETVARLARGRGAPVPTCHFVPQTSGAAPDTLVAAPVGAARLAGAAGGARAAAALFVTDPAGPEALPAPGLLAEGLGLTAAEAEVARLAAMGRGLGFVADCLGVSLNTVRTHLKAVYAKTGVNHQAALARTIADRFPLVRGLGGD